MRHDTGRVPWMSSMYKKLLGRIVVPGKTFGNFEADALTMAIGRAYKAKKITDEEADLLKAFLDVRLEVR